MHDSCPTRFVSCTFVFVSLCSLANVAYHVVSSRVHFIVVVHVHLPGYGLGLFLYAHRDPKDTRLHPLRVLVVVFIEYGRDTWCRVQSFSSLLRDLGLNPGFSAASASQPEAPHPDHRPTAAPPLFPMSFRGRESLRPIESSATSPVTHPSRLRTLSLRLSRPRSKRNGLSVARLCLLQKFVIFSPILLSELLCHRCSRISNAMQSLPLPRFRQC